MEKVIFLDDTVAYTPRFGYMLFRMCPDATVVMLANLGEDNLRDYLEDNQESQFLVVTTSGEFSHRYDGRVLRYSPQKDCIEDTCRKISDIFRKWELDWSPDSGIIQANLNKEDKP